MRDNFSEAFIKTGNDICRVILDCAELFIERPKSLDCQAATLSDYNHRSTIKSLARILPSGFVTFLNSCYGGRVIDRFITKDNGF